MRSCSITKGILGIVFVSVVLFNLPGRGETRKASSGLLSLLPELEGWKRTESPQIFHPENLFEYINGAAEIYLAYDFKELLVAQLGKDEAEANLSIEIYDMGTGINAFGIYSAERYPESRFIPAGIQGYIEEGMLNFLVNRFYVKLLCFDCDEQSENILQLITEALVKKVGDSGRLPDPLGLFPQDGMIANSEKYILNNFMGYGFLHDGYLAGYATRDGNEFECFLIVGKDAQDGQEMLEQYLAAKVDSTVSRTEFGYHIKDRYYQNIYLSRVDNYILGVFKIKDGMGTLGEKYLKEMQEAVKS